MSALMAKLVRRVTSNDEINGSNPFQSIKRFLFFFSFFLFRLVPGWDGMGFCGRGKHESVSCKVARVAAQKQGQLHNIRESACARNRLTLK